MKLLLNGDFVSGDMSPPARGRGLKQFSHNGVSDIVGSPPARGRGLKQNPTPEKTDQIFHVAPRAGAWIETEYMLMAKTKA